MLGLIAFRQKMEYAEVEAEFMWLLLEPSILSSEVCSSVFQIIRPPILASQGGYYLTAFSSAIRVIKSYSNITGAIPQQLRLPSIDDMQSSLLMLLTSMKFHVFNEQRY